MEYAVKKNVSLSTLRRYIKANKIQYKIEDGRYLIHDGETLENHSNVNADSSRVVSNLSTELKKAQEEIAELKTLIAFYEEKSPQQKLGQ
jgi:predicted site-specific integrase-resolvase